MSNQRSLPEIVPGNIIPKVPKEQINTSFQVSNAITNFQNPSSEARMEATNPISVTKELVSTTNSLTNTPLEERFLPAGTASRSISTSDQQDDTSAKQAQRQVSLLAALGKPR